MTVGPMALNATLSMNSNTMVSATLPNENRDGWDNEDWGSLEEEPVNEELEEKASNDMNHASASRSNSNSQSHSSSMGVYNNNISNNVSPSKNGGDTTTTTTTQHNSSANNSNWDNYGPSWNDDDDFEPLEETGTFILLMKDNFIKFPK